MQIEFTKKYGRQVDKYRDKKVRKNLSEVIDNILKAPDISEIKNLKKLKGHKSFYGIRMGDFRIGIALENDKVILAAFDHRADIILLNFAEIK